MKSARTLNQKKVRARRREFAYEYLGNVCSNCGIRGKLDFDHIDPTTKLYLISGLLSSSMEKLITELKKCQLLCKPCHIKKTLGEQGLPRATHGTVAMYSNHKCRCELCRTAWAQYMKPRAKGYRDTMVMKKHASSV